MRRLSASSTIWLRFSECCSRTTACARCPTRSARTRHHYRTPTHALNELETQGKAIFVRACAQCHGGPRQSTTPFPIVRYHDILTQCPRPPQNPLFAFKPCPTRLTRNARTYEIEVSAETTLPNGVVLPKGAKIRRTSSDPGRALITGWVGGPAPPFDDWNKFDVPGLRGIRNTAPYFHNNSADTLEEVVDHYIELFKFIKAVAPPGLPPPLVASTD